MPHLRDVFVFVAKVGKHGPQPALINSAQTPRAPSFSRFLRKGWDSANPDSPSLNSAQKMGAPHLDFEMWESTNPRLRGNRTASALAEKCVVRHEVSGHDFSCAENAAKEPRALAPEGRIFCRCAFPKRLSNSLHYRQPRNSLELPRASTSRPMTPNLLSASDSAIWRESRAVPSETRVCEDSSRFVCEKTRARLTQSSRFHHLCRFISWESEELDERPHALFLTAGRKSLGSCQLGDAMEARPEQFR